MPRHDSSVPMLVNVLRAIIILLLISFSDPFRRDFRKGNYREIRKNLAHIDWDEKMKNKTATECWDILRGELDTAIDSYVPMKKQGKRSKKKHLSKETFRKMRYKQNMWRVYKHTGKDKDYEVYKEALNAATNEVRKAKRNVEHTLAQNIKSDSIEFLRVCKK